MNREMQHINRPRGYTASLMAPVRIPWGWLTCIGVAAVLEYGIWQEEWYGWMPMVCGALVMVFCPPRFRGNGLRTVSLVLWFLVMGLLIGLPPLQPYTYAFKVFCLVMCSVVIPIWGASMRRMAKQLDRP